MAKSSSNVDSWPGFLAELSKSFLILRDVFGYALPGAVFLSIGVLCRRFSLHDVQYYMLDPYKLPAWLALIVGLGACYTIGHVMAAIAYLPFDFQAQSPTEVPVKLIQARDEHPELLIELDRQSTMTMLRGSTGVSVLLASLFFWWLPKTPPLGWMLSGGALLLLFVFYKSAIPHIGRLTNDTAKAFDDTSAAAKQGLISPAHVRQTLQDFIDAATDALNGL